MYQLLVQLCELTKNGTPMPHAMRFFLDKCKRILNHLPRVLLKVPLAHRALRLAHAPPHGQVAQVGAHQANLHLPPAPTRHVDERERHPRRVNLVQQLDLLAAPHYYREAVPRRS